jgi:nicotinate-nucleotide adenylyltransferase
VNEPVGVLGGSFDPVHFGHLRTALEVLESCQLGVVHLVPSGVPPHRRPPVAPAAQRLRMLQAAVAGAPRLVVDDRELRRAGPSYTVDSLAGLRAEFPARPLCLIVGADAFLALPTWHRWRELLAFAHLVVVHRPGWRLEPAGELARLLEDRRSDGARALQESSAGRIRVQPVTALDISSSAIRALVARGGDPRFLVPDPVRELILDSGCYSQPPAPKEAQLRA